MGDVASVVGRAGITEQSCPQCQSSIPVYRDFITWCDNCNWNVQPHEPDPPANVFEAIYVSLGKRLGRGLFQELGRAHSLKPKLTVSQILAFFIALLTHGFSLLVAIAGLVLIFQTGVSCLGLLGLVLVASAWVVRPRIPQLGKEDEVVPRERVPTLYATLERIAEALGAPRANIVVVDEDWNAAFGRVGWRRKNTIFIGLPLFTVLDGQERVALLSHEIAHGINGDLTRSFFVGTAIDSLVRWYVIIHPDHIWDPEVGEGFMDLPGNLIRAGLSSIIKLWLYVLANLLWRDSQRAEYLADTMASSVSGTAAMMSMLGKLHLGNTFHMTLHWVCLNNKGQNLFDELRARALEVPQRELERIKRVERLHESRLDTTHPPTAYRIELIQSRPVTEPKVSLSKEEIERMERELSALQKPIQERLMDLHMRTIY
jgi:Zn-dependent protease with chaperone function